MKGKLNIYYDEEGDFLELHIGKFTKGYFRNLGRGIFERVDDRTNQVTGIAIMGFKERTRKGDLTIPLPFKVELHH